jgi:hypothetical protein
MAPHNPALIHLCSREKRSAARCDEFRSGGTTAIGVFCSAGPVQWAPSSFTMIR